MESQVNIYTCTDACTHSNQGVGTEVEWLEHTQSTTQRNPCFHVNMLLG